MRLLIAVCCVVAWGGVACAEGKHADARGLGLTSCAEYAKAYRTSPDATDYFFLTWAFGFISGVNAASEAAYLDLGAKTPDEMKRFLRMYCNDHPLANFGEAAGELLKSLPIRKRKDDAPALR